MVKFFFEGFSSIFIFSCFNELFVVLIYGIFIMRYFFNNVVFDVKFNFCC